MTTKQKFLVAMAIGCLTIALMLKVLISTKHRYDQRIEQRIEQQTEAPLEPSCASEYTYKGHLYVRFSNGATAWGAHAVHCPGVHK